MAPHLPLPLPPLALAYHGVADVPLRADPHGLFVAPGKLEHHIRTLRAWGYRLVTFRELARVAASGTANGCAALTFDDGFADNLTALAPLLRRHDAPATVFAVPGLLGERHPDAPDAPLLTQDQLGQLARTPGIEIGGHSLAHRDLTTLTSDEARDDLVRSKDQLEDILQIPVDTAAYPYGRATPETARACRDAGFVAACRVSGEGSWQDPWNLPRQDMDGASSTLGLLLKRLDRYEPLMRSRGGRAVRRARRVLLSASP